MSENSIQQEVYPPLLPLPLRRGRWEGANNPWAPRLHIVEGPTVEEVLVAAADGTPITVGMEFFLEEVGSFERVPVKHIGDVVLRDVKLWWYDPQHEEPARILYFSAQAYQIALHRTPVRVWVWHYDGTSDADFCGS